MSLPRRAPALKSSSDVTLQRGRSLAPLPFALLLFALLLIALPARVAMAQFVTASLRGTVQDPSGATVSGAKVTVTNTSTGVAAHADTDTAGRFIFPSLAPGGPYRVSIEAPGFKAEERSGINLAVNQVVDINVPLQIGETTQKVEVNADASQLETDTAAIGQVIDNRSVDNLPLNQRNVYSLMFLVPGVTGSVTYQYNSLNFSVNGGRPGTTSVLVDGIPASPPLIVPIGGFAVFPSVDAVQEFKVETNAYSAEFGRSGSGIVNVILKQGTNKFHGSLYDFVRNSALDANTFFANRNGTPLPNFSRNQFGGSLNGPVRIPKVYNGKDKTFFLFSYEGLRQGTQTELTTTVPTALQRAGDFSQTFTASGAPVVIYDPNTTTASGTGYVRQPFAGNKITTIDPVAAKIIGYYPLPNQAGTAFTGTNNYFASGTSQLNIDTFDTRVDEVFNERNRLFVSYSRRNLSSPPALLFPQTSQVAEGGQFQPQTSNSAAIDYTRTISPTFIVDVPFGFSRTFINFTPISAGFNPSTQLGFPGYIASNADHLLFPGIAPANYYTLGDAAQGQTRRGGFNIYLLGVNNTKILGQHVLKFGGDIRLLQANDVESGSSTGSYTFTNAITQGPNPNVATATGGNALASLLLGVGTGTYTIGSKNAATQSRYYGAYIQDDWKAFNRLTVNLGLRYDLDIPRTERHDRAETFDPNAASPLASASGIAGLTGGVAFTGANGASRRQFNPQYANFGPRIGLAYQVNGNTAIRGAYGVYFGPSLRSAGATIGNEGFSAVTTYTGSSNGLTPSVFLSNPFPTGLNQPVGSSQGLATGIGSSFENPLIGDNKVGYTQNYDVDIQRQLPFNILVDAAYVGSHGVHLNKSGESDWNANQLTPAALALGTQLQQSVANPFYGIITTGAESGKTIPRSYLAAPFPQFTAVYLSYLSGGYEIYNAFQLKVNKRISHGLSALVSYTAQKQIDNYSGIQNVGNITGGIQNIYNPGAERSISSNNLSRVLVVSGVYALPFGRGQQFGSQWSKPLDALLGGWQINGITTQQTGFPLSPSTQNTSNSGSNVLRPNLTGVSPVVHGPIISRLNGYLNTAAFSQPAPFTFGNAPRTLSAVRGPGTHNLDFSLFKNFHPTEKVALEFRAEAFNLLNQVVFGTPNMTLSSGQFGVISSQANTPRQIQLAVKAVF
ncbi:TonB-dependent receptor [Granulicella sibirica]|uniref:Oar protein n=1 Tax=Granulicella sibirica TaxID=2479048 RepID=A0A4V1L569_9BACT|nr:carboxypeptidase regulatory-like domain-containing protein [Granulicella sibirica]RXH54724.1 Oar protein [Granulicella sibirica]